MKHFIQILVLCIGIPMAAGAQTFTQRLQKQPATGQGSVTIHQSDSIDHLVNSVVLTTTKSTPSASSASSSSRPSSTSSASSSSSSSRPSSEIKSTTPQTVETPDTLTQKMIRGGHKVTGYRVQAFAGGNSRKDRQKAEQTRNSIKSHYPNVPVYVHFYSPRWICRVGNYRTYEEAHQMLVSLRNLGFDQATIVKGKITVKE